MTPRDRSRDLRIEDPTNRWLIHPLAHRLLAPALRLGISANLVSIVGFAVGAGAALCFEQWRGVGWVALGLALAILWLALDGLDGMVARATGTASPLGRVLDGVCDHGVFILVYIALAASLGTAGGWALALVAGAAHAIQSSLYEGERARYHRRVRGLPPAPAVHRNPVVRTYDRLAGSVDRVAARFDRALAARPTLSLRYAAAAARPMRLMIALTANTRVELVVLACWLGDPRLFWWAEIGPLTLVTAAGLWWHRRVEAELVATPLRAP